MTGEIKRKSHRCHNAIKGGVKIKNDGRIRLNRPW